MCIRDRARPVGGRVSKAQGQSSKASGEEASDQKNADALSALPEDQATTDPLTEVVVKTAEAGAAVVSAPVVKTGEAGAAVVNTGEACTAEIAAWRAMRRALRALGSRALSVFSGLVGVRLAGGSPIFAPVIMLKCICSGNRARSKSRLGSISPMNSSRKKSVCTGIPIKISVYMTSSMTNRVRTEIEYSIY